MIRPDCPISGTHDYGMHRLARAYVRADARALRRFTVLLGTLDIGRPATDWNANLPRWEEAQRTADRLAAMIAANVRPDHANLYRSEPTMAHRLARLTLGLER